MRPGPPQESSAVQHRSVAKVIVLSLVTLGIYCIVWTVATKREMNARGTTIPSAWWLIVPIANIWWAWKYAEGVEQTTGGRLGAATTFLLLWLTGIIGMAIVQTKFNELSAPQPAYA
jgi:hypothetical protein